MKRARLAACGEPRLSGIREEDLTAMIKSMTGYGGAKGMSGDIEISVELKSVNSRFLDCTIKLPRIYMSFEEPVKAAVGRVISRGKTDVYITIDSGKSSDTEIRINRPLAEAYITALRALAKEFSLPDNISVMDLVRFPDVCGAEKKETDQKQLCADIIGVLEDALRSFEGMRINEGQALRRDILRRADEICTLILKVEEISPRSVEEYRRKLEAKMLETLNGANIDEQRILLEAAVFADRVAVNEEVVRLRSHVDQLRELLESTEPVGRKIDFLVQEMGREANTIASKGNDAEMAKAAVDLKAEIEKIREQAQNIE